MALVPILTLVSAGSDTITVLDSTGSYSASNPGGFGTPNPATSDVSKVLLRVTTLDKPESHSAYLLTNPSDIIGVAAGIALTPADFPGVGSVFSDAVWNIKYDICTTLSGLSLTPGDTAFTLTDADTVLEGVAGFLISDLDTTKIWFIDQTVELTSTGGRITEKWPSGASSTPTALKVWEGDTNILVNEAALRCLASEIAKWSDGGCGDNEEVWDHYKLSIALQNKFDAGCLKEANDMAIALASYCDCNTDCGCS